MVISVDCVNNILSKKATFAYFLEIKVEKIKVTK